MHQCLRKLRKGLQLDTLAPVPSLRLPGHEECVAYGRSLELFGLSEAGVFGLLVLVSSTGVTCRNFLLEIQS